jgi:urate oxidase
MTELSWNSYGKSAVRLLKVERSGSRHEIRDLTVDIALSGDFESAHTSGDNSAVLPTDTMKNTVYAKAREQAIGQPEEFGLRLAAHFLGASAAAETATVRIAEHGWRRQTFEGRPHDHAFERGSTEQRTARVSANRSGVSSVTAGIADLVVLKTAQSGFTGFPRDRYTTLRETTDRILATSITTTWRYGATGLAYGTLWLAVRRQLLETFADHESASVQHTLYALGEAVLEGCAEVEEITISMPNKHHLLVDLAPFGLENPNEVFVPTTEPYGLIEASMKRQG